jgi:hypothetical protein
MTRKDPLLSLGFFCASFLLPEARAARRRKPKAEA